MLKKLKQSEQKGFTIIEVVIVLAIAGLILLIVFLAIPALQRNARNSGIKNDATALSAGLGEFASNNNGAQATLATLTNGTAVIANATITTGATAKLQGATNVNGGNTGARTFAVTPIRPVAGDAAAGSLFVVRGEGCQTTSGVTPTLSARAYAIYYWSESPSVTAAADATTGIINGTGLKGQCLES